MIIQQSTHIYIEYSKFVVYGLLMNNCEVFQS